MYVGSDSCRLSDTYCGLVSPHLASLMLEVFKCTQAMSMVTSYLTSYLAIMYRIASSILSF